MRRTAYVHLLLLLVLALSYLLPTASAGAATVELTTRQATANIAFTLSADQARQDIRAMARHADVIGWQEISNPYQARAIDALDRFNTWWPGGRSASGRPLMTPRNTNPISYRSDVWRRVDQGSRLSAPEIEDVSRDRYVSWVVLKHRRSGRLVARWNVHFVPNAWGDARYRTQLARQEAWTDQARVVRRVHLRLVSRGIPVFGGGDINRRNVEFIGDVAVYDTLSSGRIDNLVHSVTTRIGVADKPSWLPLNSDHDGLVLPYVVGVDVAVEPASEEPHEPGGNGGGNGNGHGPKP
ncbi:MAG TPA: hypothetical protein VFK41_11655 [Nocardioidaceae bacterium]|nr:hypothetical protein [Nocardioidaceae bacterium]